MNEFVCDRCIRNVAKNVTFPDSGFRVGHTSSNPFGLAGGLWLYFPTRLFCSQRCSVAHF